MSAHGLTISDDASVGAWIEPRLRGSVGAVAATVPAGYRAYVRICHLATDRDGTPVTWSEVADETGRRAHPAMQWHALVGSSDYNNFRGSLWPGRNPRRGSLDPAALGPLCDLLAEHTGTPERCFLCVWDGYGWDSSPPDTGLGSDWPARRVFSHEELSRPRLHLPLGRSYIIITGPLAAAAHIGYWHTADWFTTQSPNLFWPADHAWCVGSEIDFDSTLIGGSSELADAVTAAPDLDSWPVQPDASLSCDADHVNPIP